MISEVSSVWIASWLLVAGETGETVRAGVLEMTVDGGADPVVGTQMTGRLAEVLGKRPGFSVIAPDDIRAILEQEAHKQLLGCDEESCLAELGGALGADVLIKGRISKLDNGYAIALSLVDAQRAEARGHASEVWKGESIGLLELVEPMVDRLFAPKGAVLTGILTISGVADGSQILVDDQVRGTAPAGQMAGIPTGARRVQVVHEGHVPIERWVVIKNGGTTTLAVRQETVERDPFYSTWWFWTATAAGVAGAAVGAAFLLQGGNAGVGATGVSVMVNGDTAFGGGR